ncbi:a-kinase anchor protein 17b-like [Lynx pardinus]|nr:a-kinase anchor protein 17b-like [Lynx pardinus]
MPKYQVAKLHHKQKEKMKKINRAHLPPSPLHLRRKEISSSARGARAGKSLANGYDESWVSDQSSLQNATVQGQPLEKEDRSSSHKSDSYRLFERGRGRKQKIYETDEFIDYMLNCYQPPNYARICLEPSGPESTREWQRAVHAKGNGFRVTLRKRNYHSTSPSPVQTLATGRQAQKDDGCSEICTRGPEHKPQKRGRVDYAKESRKELNHCKDTASEAGGHLSPTDAMSHLSEEIYAYEIRVSKSTSQSQDSSPNRSADVEMELTDFLEEISSDSECFSEILSIKKEDNEKSVTTYDSSPEKRSLDAAEIITSDQEVRSSPQTWCSEWNREGEERYSKYELWKPVKRSRYELTCPWLEGENGSMRGEKNNSRNRETLAPKYLFDEGDYRGSRPSDLLDDMVKKRRRFDDSTFGQNVNYRSPHVPITSSNSADVFYLRGFPRRRETPWRPDYNQEVRRFKRYENSKDFRLNSDNYYIRRNSQEHADYGSYSQNGYTSPLYHQMF